MKRRICIWMLCLVLLVPVTALTARADCGPKPTTSVKITETHGKRIVVTLLAEAERNGPYHTIQKEETTEDWWQDLTPEEAKAWEAFRDYQDPDGFHFWGVVEELGIDWTYYPPETFKVAIYYPEKDIVLVSQQTFERYAFHSDYSLWITVDDYDQSGSVPMELKNDTDWTEEVFGFLCRAALTMMVELALAFGFGYRKKGQVMTILLVNLVTQVGLNVLLSLWYLFSGPLSAMLRLAAVEIVVLIVEGIAYWRKLEGKKSRTVWYAIVANLASCAVGWMMLDR